MLFEVLYHNAFYDVYIKESIKVESDYFDEAWHTAIYKATDLNKNYKVVKVELISW